MKLKYKKLIIGITVVTLALSFFILTLIPTGGSEKHSAADAELVLNQNEDINKLIADYYAAKKIVDIETMSTLVSDPNQIEREKFTAMAAYVEDYQNINCYMIKSEEEDAYRVYARYDMKLKNIESLGPCLTSFYVTTTSDGKYVIYLSALDEVQEDFISAADENSDVLELEEEVANGLQEVIDKDESFKQFYQKLDKEIQSTASGSAAAGQ
ncbi:MAG: hypothetical protein J1F02_03840 [Lachnospiraceae bacterium]|nr:hypothetical protein [Lachnospiraceae bacterium]